METYERFHGKLHLYRFYVLLFKYQLISTLSSKIDFYFLSEIDYQRSLTKITQELIINSSLIVTIIMNFSLLCIKRKSNL